MKFRTGSVVVSSVVAILLAAGSADAQSEAQKAAYGRYHQAVEAVKLCRKTTFSESDHAMIGEAIDQKVGQSIGAGRLSLLTAAQREARALIKRTGCASSDAQALIAVFDADLKPALDAP